MEREFVFTNEFLKRWETIGFQEEDLRELEIYLCNNHLSGSVITGTGGAEENTLFFS